MIRLADLRSTITDLESAKKKGQEIALKTIAIEKSKAALEDKIAKLKAAHEEATAETRAALDADKAALSTWIAANPDKFQKPRTVKTEFLEFGLRTVTDLVVSDEPAAINHCLANDGLLGDVVVTVHKLDKTQARAAIAQGNVIPGCQVRTGDTCVCKVNKALIDEAINS
jgi:hypothetical protein